MGFLTIVSAQITASASIVACRKMLL